MPKYQEFVFDDAKREFGAYAFRFANPTVPEGQAVKAVIPMMNGSIGGTQVIAGTLFVTVLLSFGGFYLLRFADNFAATSKFSQPLPEG